MTLWLSSRAALLHSKSVSPRSSAGGHLSALAAEIEACGVDAVGEALDAEIRRRAARCLQGLEAYRRHPFRRQPQTLPVLWREGTTRLIDFGAGGADPAVLVVPSLINRWHVLDLLPERSFLRHLAEHGLRPLVVDWGAPGPDECRFDLADYVAGRLDRAFVAAARVAGAPLAVLGYCMGGLLALALALRRRRQVACLALLATPWDFHAEREGQARLLALVADWLPYLCGAGGPVPVDVIQSLFLLLDPFIAPRKFDRFASLDHESQEARGFVALEDWINDGVPMPLPTMQTCLRSWYGGNEPARGFGGSPAVRSARNCCAGPASSSFPAATISSHRARPSRSPPPSARRRRAAPAARPCRHDGRRPRSGFVMVPDRRMAAPQPEPERKSRSRLKLKSRPNQAECQVPMVFGAAGAPPRRSKPSKPRRTQTLNFVKKTDIVSYCVDRNIRAPHLENTVDRLFDPDFLHAQNRRTRGGCIGPTAWLPASTGMTRGA